MQYRPIPSGALKFRETGPSAPFFLAEEYRQDLAHPVMLTPSLPSKSTFGPIVVPEGQYFLMGDNRDNSFDSRYFGCVAREQIVGQATAIALSLDPFHFYLPRWNRWFTLLR